MIIKTPVGIVSYGAVLPRTMITVQEVGLAHGSDGRVGKALGIKQKTVPAIDEDAVTLATAAGAVAMDRWLTSFEKDGKKTLQKSTSRSVHLDDIQALFIGSESHPYAVKPTGTVVKEALGLGDQLALADLQFACKAGTQSLQIALSYVASGMARVGMAIGADTAQARPGDVLEYTAAAGAAAYLVAADSAIAADTNINTNLSAVIARCLGTMSIATDTPDFWRRPGQPYPEHAGRFSGEPGYFWHIHAAATCLMDELRLAAADFSHCVFHTPNGKFPKQIAQRLGFTREQLELGLIVSEVGNTYAAASLIGLAAALDQAQPGQKILLASYGSGAGSDAFVFETTPALTAFQQRANKHHPEWQLREQVRQLTSISYHEYQHAMEGRQ